ncbi:hypothetical protein EDD86DRAFT_185782 [Gorgonomyces haynaldii]|nr:hypothetical protein EDD86DRAFT_185782 [Gorgonomyces haynaldii]
MIILTLQRTACVRFYISNSDVIICGDDHSLCCSLFWLLLNLVSTSRTCAYISCPPAVNFTVGRPAQTTPPCENFDPATAFVQTVNAGDRLKVGWTSGNRGGGFVRLALAPYKTPLYVSTFNKNVLKVTCFGSDQRLGKYLFGSCNHPCNGRGSCAYPKTANTERFDTGITIPTNLAAGRYILQLKAYAGVFQQPIYSCAMLQINGGNTNLKCTPNSGFTAPSCVTASAPGFSTLVAASSYGSFCYSKTGTSSIDANVNVAPVNLDCDPRQTCEFANSPELCSPSIFRAIVAPQVSPHAAACPTPAF